MATFLLLHGAASSGWYWHRVESLLVAAGHRVVAPDLPADDPDAGIDRYVATALDALGEGAEDGGLVVVAQSMAGVFAPVLATRRATDHLVLLAAMVPVPGERGHDWWGAVGQAEAQRRRFVGLGLDPSQVDDPDVVYGHDVPAEVWIEAGRRVREQSGRPFGDPCPIECWPSVPTTVVAAADDRLFPLELQRRVAHERLGLKVVVVPGGHLPALSEPSAVAEVLLGVA
ncbi:MAG: alpha/beta fold hydrolase [Actinomycetota bacterium]